MARKIIKNKGGQGVRAINVTPEWLDELREWLESCERPQSISDIIMRYKVSPHSFLTARNSSDELEEIVQQSNHAYGEHIKTMLLTGQIDPRAAVFVLKCNHAYIEEDKQRELDRKEREFKHRVKMDLRAESTEDKSPVTINFQLATKENIEVVSTDE